MQNNDIIYCRASSDEELNQILKLQKQNLPRTLSVSEKENEGFVTVDHKFEILKQMNDYTPHVIAKQGEKVVGYALCMHPKFADGIEILKPMFKQIDKVFSKPETYIVMGQVCVDKTYRKMGIFRGLYNFMKQELKENFNYIITEVDAKNTRSLNAHLAIGFTIIKEFYTDETDWIIISLNCNSPHT